MYACFCDYELPEWLTVKNVKSAKKSHRCSECGAVIPAGAAYEYNCGKWDGYVDQFHVCLLCVELRNWATISVPCFCWTYGSLHEQVRDMVHEVSPDVPGFFMEYGRRKIKIRRAKALNNEKE